jgi:hypothetical protein
MRKKSEVSLVSTGASSGSNTPGVANKVISKNGSKVVSKNGSKVGSNVPRSVNKVHDVKPPTPIPMHAPQVGLLDQSPVVADGSSVYDNVFDDVVSNSGSAERSTTPMESELLKYLTAHIKPAVSSGYGSSVGDTFTSFVIGREEYLQGIVRLIHSDCPEVVKNMDLFLGAMQQAFEEVHAVF